MNKGFTLVELAIVMTIIGLLIGGILKGQELLANARITSTIAQVKSYSAAVTTFKDTYDYYPGDLPRPDTHLPGCNVNCGSAQASGTTGDGYVGNYLLGWVFNASGTSSVALPSAMGVGVGEPTVFFIQLFKAGLVSGLSDAFTITAMAPAIGLQYPAAKTGGAFFTRSLVNSMAPAGSPVAVNPANLAFVLIKEIPAANNSALPATSNGSILTPGRAAQFDRKIDDGVPVTGSVVAYGNTVSCFAANGSSYMYDETIVTNDCGLIFINN